jgi:hypothetical protein
LILVGIYDGDRSLDGIKSQNLASIASVAAIEREREREEGAELKNATT